MTDTGIKQSGKTEIGSQHAYVGRRAWCEGTLTRAEEIRTLADWAADVEQSDRPGWDRETRQKFKNSIHHHVDHAEEAAKPGLRQIGRTGTHVERAKSSLDAAEADLLRLAPADFVVGQLPSIVNHVGRHLQATDPRRDQLERIYRRVGAVGSLARERNVDRAEGRQPIRRNRRTRSADASIVKTEPDVIDERNVIVNAERGVIVSAVRGAGSVALREQTRLRSFRNAVVATTVAMFVVAAGLVVLGAVSPTTVPLCFAPEEADEVTVVCPTEQSGPLHPIGGQVSATRINNVTRRTVNPIDTSVVAVLGATAAAIAAAAAIRRLRGSSEPFGVPIALAILKLPTGAVTAVLGLVLMRGGFVPGLSALDTSAQILAWAAIFGYAQQLFTRLVDQQAHTVLDSVRGGDKATEASRSS